MDRAAYSVSETAYELRVSERLVRSEIAKGNIPCFNVGRRVLVPGWFIEIRRELPEWWKDGDDPNSDGPRDA